MAMTASADARPGDGRWDATAGSAGMTAGTMSATRAGTPVGMAAATTAIITITAGTTALRPKAYWDAPGYRPGYANWRRGTYLPSCYNGFVVTNYGSCRLRPPPRGYHWVRVNNDYLLVAIATGLIFDVIANN